MSVGDLEFVTSGTPYVYFGDSHAGFLPLILKDPLRREHIVTSSSLIWGFCARDVFDEESGMVAQPLIETLRRCWALHSSERFKPTPGLPSVQVWRDGKRSEQYLQVTKLSEDRPYIMCVGELNVRSMMHRLALDGLDFTVPFDTAGLERLDDVIAVTTLEFGKILSLAIEEFGPLFRGLRALKEAGLRTLYLHSLPPPSLDFDTLSERFGYFIPPRIYYKLTMLANFLFERVCKETGVGFINTWQTVTEGNLRKPEYELDIVHLNQAHAIASVREVHRKFSVEPSRDASNRFPPQARLQRGALTPDN